MSPNQQIILSQCQNDLEKQGFCTVSIAINAAIKQAVVDEDYQRLDKLMQQETLPQGCLFKELTQFCQVKEIEFIISLRVAGENEEGIWHDDGSRILAFSLSLSLNEVEGGVLEFRKKDSAVTHKLATPAFGDMFIFKTGVDHYEHKINEVTKGKRLVIAGWCYP